MVRAKRIIPCLDMKGGRVVKGVNFVNIRDAGDPVELAQRYEKEGADELTFLDISASNENRNILIDIVKKTADAISIPLCVGGGIRTVEDFDMVLKAGASKCSISTASIKTPDLINNASKKFGPQCVVVAMDVKRVYVNNPEEAPGKTVLKIANGTSPYAWYEVMINGGKVGTGLDAVQWAKEVEKRGAGEILLTSMGKDGTMDGYDLEITREIKNNVSIPITASGGAGTEKNILDAFKVANADAALAASIFHDIGKPYHRTVGQIKKYLKENGIKIRE